ncbi:MAG: hypothetical protein AVDCRST_MAG64-4371, partial [uncultured Phycisphaerae bacterium]
VMALLAPRGFSTPSLPAQGGQRRFPVLNIERDITPLGLQMSYDAAGSNDGIAKVVSREVEFATTSSPMSAGRLRDRHLVQFPSMLGSVVFTANLPGVAVNEFGLM